MPSEVGEQVAGSGIEQGDAAPESASGKFSIAYSHAVVQASSAGSDGSGGGGGSTDDGSAVAGEETSSSDDGSGLPSTGGETLSILLLGAATLGFGVLLRRRRET